MTKPLRRWQSNRPILAILAVVATSLLAVGVWALAPLFYDRQVDEPFPVASLPTPSEATKAPVLVPTEAVAAPTREAFTQTVSSLLPTQSPAPTDVLATATILPPSEVPPVPTEAPLPTEAPPAPTEVVAPTEAPPAPTEVPAEPVVLGGGSFVAGSVAGDVASGQAMIYQIEGGGRLLRLEDFAATNGPDLFVVFSASDNPDRDGLTPVWYQLAPLKGNVGNQNYELPADLELSQYRSVVIWCRAFDVVFGYAPLS